MQSLHLLAAAATLQGMENADKCAWTFGTTYTTSSGAQANINIGGQDYLIQQVGWSCSFVAEC
jgi:hypothetical protein